MKNIALFLGYGLLPLWTAVVVMIVGGLQPHPSEYWAVAPWLIIAAIPVCGVTMLISAATVVVQLRASGDEPRKKKLAAWSFWLLNLGAAAVIGALWLRHESLQNEAKIEEGLALDFAKNHSAVVQKVGTDAAIYLSSTQTSAGSVLPAKYEFSIEARIPDQRNTNSLFAIVSVSRTSGERKFTLDCITPLSLGYRDPHKDPCAQ